MGETVNRVIRHRSRHEIGTSHEVHARTMRPQRASGGVGPPVDTNHGMVAQRFRITADGGDDVDGCIPSRHGDVINEPRPLPSWIGNVPRRNLKTQLV
jgi:hypothetical protein